VTARMREYSDSCTGTATTRPGRPSMSTVTAVRSGGGAVAPASWSSPARSPAACSPAGSPAAPGPVVAAPVVVPAAAA